MADQNLKILIDSVFSAKGFEQANKSIGEVDNGTKKLKSSNDLLSSSFSSLSGILATVGFATLAKEAIGVADRMNNLSARIKLVSVAGDDLHTTQSKLLSISNQNKTSLESVTALYVKLADPIRQLGGTTQTAMNITNAFSKALLVGGANTQEAASATLQFAQAMGSGVLRGDEFNSIAEASPRILQAVADSLGVAKGALREMASEGKLTAGMVGGALLRSMVELEAEAKQMPNTISGAFQVLKNNIADSTYKFDEATHSSSLFANGITDLSSNTTTFTNDLIHNMTALQNWIKKHKEGLGELGSTAGNIIGFASKTAQVTVATKLSTISTGANIIGTMQDFFTPDSVKQDRLFVESVNKKAAASKENKKVLKEIEEINKQIASAGNSPEKKKEIDNISKKADVLEKVRKAYVAQGLSADSVNKLVAAQSGLYDENIRQAQKLESHKTTDVKLTAEQKQALREHDAEVKKYAASIADLSSKTALIGKNDFEKENIAIDEQAKKWREAKIEEPKIQEFVSKSKADIKKKYEDKAKEDALAAIKVFDEGQARLGFEADEQSKAAVKTYNDGLISAQIETYTAMGDTTSAYYIQEEEKMRKLAETGWYTNEQMLAIKTKDNEKFQKEQWDRDNKFWADTFVNINKAMDDQFFNAMSGKFTSFGDWLKDFWGSITQSMTRGLSKSLADTIMGTGNNSEGGIANWFKSYGGLGSVFGASMAPAALMGAVTDSAGFTTTSGGTVFDAAGKITKAGTDGLGGVGDMLSNASSLNSVYNALTGGLSASVANGFAQGAAYTYNGLTAMGMSTGTAGSIAGGIGNFGAGMAAPWSTGASSGLAAQGGAMLGGAALGAAGGYALGSIGDKLFGAETKAANYAAIGGAIGSLAGPIGAVAGAVIGSLIGGAFGKKKTSVTGSGVQFWDEGSAANINVSSYVDKMEKKKSWFKSSERYWTEYSAISDSDKLNIKKTFDVYNYLLLQLDKAAGVSIAAGKYSGQTFQDAMAKNFITKFTGIEETITKAVTWWRWSYNTTVSNPEFTKIYSYWTDYAKSVSKTVAEALTTSVGEYITTTRSFNEWKLGSGSVDQLKFTADYLAKDFNILSESMGVSGLTVENYLQKYDEAIKDSFSPETITSWKNLGDALMSATDANTKYADSLKEVTNAAYKPADMMLGKVNDATRTAQGETLNTQLLVQIVKALKSIQSTNQFSTSAALV